MDNVAWEYDIDYKVQFLNLERERHESRHFLVA
jgi:hypothetical protein